MSRPIRIARALASRAPTAAPVRVLRPASLLVPISGLAVQKRYLGYQKSTEEPVSPNAANQKTNPLHPADWDVNATTHSLLEGVTVELTHPKVDAPIVLNRHKLRDTCQCSACVDPHSGQKNFGTTDVPDRLPISSCQKTSNGDLEIVWHEDFLNNGRDTHTSVYPAKQVESFLGIPEPKVRSLRTVLWDKKIINKDLMFVEYDDWMTSDKAVDAGVMMLQTHGILFIRNAPHSEESVISMSSRIGNLKETLYGRTWDVRSKPEAENIAYTSTFLGLHQDMLYLKDPPRLQLLHCLENSCEGGESLFSDSSLAVCLLHFGFPESFYALSHRMLTYHYNKDGYNYRNQHRVISKKEPLHQRLVRWSPPFQAPFDDIVQDPKAPNKHGKWVQAARKFQRLMEKEEFLFEYKMKPGDCVIFDNLRIVHGRRAFDTSAGSRWLKGTYNADDVFRSRLQRACAGPALAEVSPTPKIQKQVQALNKEHHIWDTADEPKNNLPNP